LSHYFWMLQRLLNRAYLDIEPRRLWLGDSWHTVYESKDGYFCPHLSVEDVSRVRSEDLPKRITLEVDRLYRPT
jgi:hypothetical protein